MIKKMKKIEVLHLVEDLKTGGLERAIATIAEGLDRQRFEASVWCIARGGAVAAELKEKGIEVKILGISTYHKPFHLLKLSRLLRKAKPDIVHTHGYFGSVIGRLAAKTAGIPILINHVHSTYWEYRKKHLLMEKFLSLVTQKIICCSKAVEDFVTGYERINPSKTLVIYNGVDEKRFSKIKNSSLLKAKLGLDSDELVIGTVSSLFPHKGHKFLFEAAPLILAAFPSTRFLIVGDGVLRRELENRAEELNLSSRVIFAGTRKDVPDLLSLMDIFVLPSSIREGLGISIIEAMAAEKPVVATDIGGIPEVVKDGQTGLLVPPRNPAALARAIIELLNDPGKAKAMGKQGRARFEEKFTIGKMLSEVENLYESLISQRKDNKDEKI
jgi:glycosyltransferase involved in cell wall biosynthesis